MNLNLSKANFHYLNMKFSLFNFNSIIIEYSQWNISKSNIIQIQIWKKW